jgi:L-asparaginase/Glu-tRNA(Gln) amidotransferase subunit D
MSQIEYVEKLNQSKIWYAATGPAWDMNPRHSEILFCGAVLLTNETPSGYYDQWEDGFNCVRYKTDLSNLNQKIDEALKKQEIITKNAYNFASENLTPNKIYERFKWITKQISKKL